jgi:hypothetical protein
MSLSSFFVVRLRKASQNSQGSTCMFIHVDERIADLDSLLVLAPVCQRGALALNAASRLSQRDQ